MKPKMIGDSVIVSGMLVFDGENSQHGRLLYLKLDSKEVVALSLDAIINKDQMPSSICRQTIEACGTYTQDIPDATGSSSATVKLIKASIIIIANNQYF
jgi:hypothetical protein